MKVTIASILAVFLTGAAFGQDAQICPDRSDAMPARLSDTEANLRRAANLSPTWRGDEQFRFTFFSAYVGIDGRLDRICCYSSTRKITNTEAGKLRPKLEDLRFIPAEHNGEKLRTYVNFTIIGVKTADGLESRLFLNQMRFREEHGIDYTSPQRVGNFRRGDLGSLRAEYVVDILPTGQPANARISQWFKGSDGLKERFVEYVSDECFIPGSINGEAVEMPYYEVIQSR